MPKTEKRRVAVIIGSDSDLPQCVRGLRLLNQAVGEGKIELVKGCVEVSSIHRATDHTLALVRMYHELLIGVDVLITGAGWANHLSGMCDAYLRYHLQDIRTVVVGVAFVDTKTEEELVRIRHAEAAKLSVSEVPGTQVVYVGTDKLGQFIGPPGFERACRFAIEGELPEISAKTGTYNSIPLAEAIALGEQNTSR